MNNGGLNHKGKGCETHPITNGGVMMGSGGLAQLNAGRIQITVELLDNGRRSAAFSIYRCSDYIGTDIPPLLGCLLLPGHSPF
jgi:hypothetical protein